MAKFSHFYSRKHSYAMTNVSALCILMLILVLPSTGRTESFRGSADLTTAIIQVAKQTIPAVVHIEVTERREVPNPFSPFEDDPFFHHFFGSPQMPKNFKRELKGLGSGMIIDAEGHILTNNHVAGGASKLQVLLSDGREYTAQLIGADPKTDLAIIKIPADKPLPFVKFGDSDKMEVGEWVVAIGHPRGLDQTVTQGIISAKHRRGITEPNSYQDFIQTDAAINPGNSGGPLLNLAGEVIGVNAAIASQSGGFEGIGFAIPSDMAKFVIKALLSHGKVERAWMGVSVQNLTPALAKSFGMPNTRGALVADIAKNGPAAKAGIRRGDVILSIGDREIPDADSLRNETAVSPIDQSVNVSIWRDGGVINLPVRMESMQAGAELSAQPLKDRLGVSVRPVNSREAEKYGLSAGQGVVITWLDPNGRLAQAGFELGDIILEVDGQSVEDAETLASSVLSAKRGQPLTMLALDHRTGNTGYIQVRVR
jgi:serine protease Do